MKIAMLIVVICISQFLFAQDTDRVRIISVDSLKQYHIGIAKADTNAIHLAKFTEKPWAQMNIGEKGVFLVKGIFKSNPIVAWGITVLLGSWLISQIYKLFNRYTL
jgi:hypothetical protein